MNDPIPNFTDLVPPRRRAPIGRKPSTPLAALTLGLMLPTASCVPSAAAERPQVVAAAPVTPIVPATAAAIASFTAPPTSPEAEAVAAGTPAPIVPPGAAPAINAGIAFAGGPNPAASAFFLRLSNAADRGRSLQCLTEAIYYEAASESDDGQRAVAQVVLNRMRHPAYPATVCGVVYQNAERWMACQFSFACDGARSRVPSAAGWARARAHAAQALAGRVHAPVGTATHYHTWNVVPFWAHKLEKNAVVGAHIFYRLNGSLGQAPAFRQRHAGYEPFPVPARAAPVAVAALPVPVETAALVLPVVAPVPASPVVAAPVVVTRTPAPRIETPVVPEPAPSPIMEAVESSTVRDEYKDSGAIRPEFLTGQ